MNIIDISRLIRPATKGWTQDELASLYRSHGFLVRSGLPLGFDQGCTDVGDPWCVFYDLRSEEVVAHFARIEGQYVVAGGMFDKTVKGATLSLAVEKFNRAIEGHLRLANNLNSDNSNVVVLPSAKLILSLATLFFLMQLDQQNAIAATSENRIDTHPDVVNQSDQQGGHWLARLVSHADANANHMAIAALMGFYLANKATDEFHSEDLTAGLSATELMTVKSQSEEHLQDQHRATSAAENMLDLSIPLMPSVSTSDPYRHNEKSEFAGQTPDVATIFSEIETLTKENLIGFSVTDVVYFAKQFVFQSAPELWDVILRTANFEMESSSVDGEEPRAVANKGAEELGELSGIDTLPDSKSADQLASAADSNFTPKERLQEFAGLVSREYSTSFVDEDGEILKSITLLDTETVEPIIESGEKGGSDSHNSEVVNLAIVNTDLSKGFSVSTLERLASDLPGNKVQVDLGGEIDSQKTLDNKAAIFELFLNDDEPGVSLKDYSSIRTAMENETGNGLNFVDGNIPEHAELLIGTTNIGVVTGNQKPGSGQPTKDDSISSGTHEYAAQNTGDHSVAQNSILAFIENAGNIAIYSYGDDLFLIEQNAISTSATEVVVERLEFSENSFATLIGAVGSDIALLSGAIA